MTSKHDCPGFQSYVRAIRKPLNKSVLVLFTPYPSFLRKQEPLYVTF